MKQSVFEDEWRRCLREHYKAVIREDDQVTQRTLDGVMHRLGFNDEDLRALYMEATMRADALPDGFMPDTARLQPDLPASHPAECTCLACSPVLDALLEAGHDEEGQPLPIDEEQALLDAPEYEPKGEDPNDPQQLSLF